MKAARFFPALLFTAVLGIGAPAAEPKELRDVEYARVGDLSLKLDLYLPEKPKPLLIVYVHGGAWRSGSKSDMPLRSLVDLGYPVASVDYRLSTQAQFPAQIHDLKAAIRFLRAKRDELGNSAARIVIAGSSAGGHLAALVGMSNGHKELEGSVGNHANLSSEVQGVVSFFGGSNLTSILSQSTEHGLQVRVPALQLLLGGQPDEKPELAKLASPVFHVDSKDPPILLFHGDADPQMPPEQSKELAAACERAKVPVTLVMIPGAGHGGRVFYEWKRLMQVKEFLDQKVLQTGDDFKDGK